MLKLNRKGQTAIETLFILAIIMTGIAMVLSSYLNENRDVSVVTYIRASASHACDYLNMGVQTSESPYSLLNNDLASLNGTNYQFRVMSIGLNETSTAMNISVSISTPFVLNTSMVSSLENSIKLFIVEDVSRNTNMGKNGTNLVYSGKIVRLNVSVVKG
ncbi:hypothetical protein DRN39_05075 [Thermococci archaeon]|nr:MAG: hypothetical protein DRN39_05075 [Thermococci archaeon]